MRKFFRTFAVESYAGGRYVLRKAFRNGSFLDRFLTYLNSVYCALRLTNRKLRNFSNRVKIKVTVNAYGYDYIHTALSLSVACCHISVGFLLFI